MKWIKLLFHPVSLIIVGCCVFLLGIALTWDGYVNGLPERNELATVAGTVRDISKMSNRTPSGVTRVRYELELMPAGKLILTQNHLSEMHIGQAEVMAMSHKPVEALITPKKSYEIWEFSADGKKLLSFGPDKESSAQRHRTETTVGLRVAAVGFLIFVIGAIALRISRSVHAARARRARH